MHTYTCTECDWTGSGTSYMDLCPLCGSEIRNGIRHDTPAVNDSRKERTVELPHDKNVFDECSCGVRR